MMGNNLFDIKTGGVLVVVYLWLSCTTVESEKYEPKWSSLDQRPLPNWFDQSKVGVFIHWGVFSVPSITSEWFWFDWQGDPNHNPLLHQEIEIFMKANYKPDFSYQDFGSQFTAEFFNASEWIDLIGRSGAKYVVLTSKHHEGFTMWPSKYSYSWNSMDIGPHRDIVGELSQAVNISKYNIKFGLYHSLYEWFHPLYMADRARNFTTQLFVDNKILPEMKELVERYRPEILWSDGEQEAESSYWKSEEFLAWLYNESPVSESVVVNDRWGTGTACKHGGYFTCVDRYTPGKLQQRKWENAMTIDKTTWGYSRRSNLSNYLTSKQLIVTLLKTVAFGGNLLINIGPSKEGTISPIFQERLLDLGKWLAENGEAIYKSDPWDHCQNDTLTSSVWYTTRNSGKDLYVIFTEWPKSSVLYLSCPQISKKSKITMLGLPNVTIYGTMTEKNYTKLAFPPRASVEGNWAWTVKIENRLV